jgi:hypothetical protein
LLMAMRGLQPKKSSSMKMFEDVWMGR